MKNTELRYLTIRAKEKEMIYLHKHRDLLDSGMINYIDALNAIEGICTLQSCAGHRKPHRYGEINRDIMNGCLWIWLNKLMMYRFRANVFTLVSNPNIEAIRTLYQPYGSEIVEIVFRGRVLSPQNDFFLEQSMDSIISYMQSLAITV